jgi:hypothetical protein
MVTATCVICLIIGLVTIPEVFSFELKQVAANMLLICSQLQNPELYSTNWANACRRERNELWATRNIRRGEIVSLYPVFAVGLPDGTQVRTSSGSASPKTTKMHSIDVLLERSCDSITLCVQADSRCSIEGWLGHCSSESDVGNCQVISLPFAPPLCGLVASCDIPSGAMIATKRGAPNEAAVLQWKLIRRYRNELAELRSYLKLAYPPRLGPLGSTESATKSTAYHSINLSYEKPLEQIHANPDIFIIRNFLSDDECDRLVAKAEPNLRPCVSKSELTGALGVDQSRTSSDANIPRAEVPTIMRKLMFLLNCSDARRFEILQVLRYRKGQQFLPHTDGFEGPITACGFEDSGRLATFFCYLNSPAKGGATRFNQLNVDIQPVKGTAVIHFPNSLDLKEDPRVEHEGCPAADEKWLLVTWLWSDIIRDPRYHEATLTSLSEDII